MYPRAPGVSIYEWRNSFGPLIRAYLRISVDQDRNVKERERRMSKY
jgi:hypothetical protein